MSIIQNQFYKQLEAVWDDLNWDRKEDYSTPRCDAEYVWHAYSKEEVKEAKKVLKNLEQYESLEDGTTLIRTAHYGSYSTGSAIVICVEKIPPEPEIIPDAEIVEKITAKIDLPLTFCSEEKLELLEEEIARLNIDEDWGIVLYLEDGSVKIADDYTSQFFNPDVALEKLKLIKSMNQLGDSDWQGQYIWHYIFTEIE